MSEPWLSVFLSVGTAVSRRVQQAAESAEVLRDLIDHEKWLEPARFSSIDFNISFDNYRDPVSFDSRLRRGVLEVDLKVDPVRLPELEEVGCQWYFFETVLDVLRRIGRSHEIGDPPLRAEWEPGEALSARNMPELAPSSSLEGGILAELSSLDEDEVLVMVRLPEGGSGQEKLINEVDEKLSSVGEVRAGSSAGEYYLFAVALSREGVS
jgi:hypothetical protein